MINIAILAHGLPPSTIGGLEVQANAWAAHLSPEHRVTVITRRVHREEPLREARDGFTVLRVERPSLRGWRSLVESREIRRCLAELNPRPDVLVCFRSVAYGLAGVRSGRALGIPAVVWITGEIEYQFDKTRWPLRWPSSLYRLISPWVWEQAATVLVQTEIGRSDFLSALSRISPERAARVRNKVDVIGNGVDIPERSPWNPDGPVLAVARLSPGKGIDTVIQACAAAGRPLVIAGDGPQRAALEALAADCRADVRFTGFVDQEALAELYREASAVVSGSVREGLPNALLEAMAHARPVVNTSVGGVRDLIEDGVNGLLISPGDTEALTAALKRLANDPDLAQRLGTAARITAQRFEWTCWYHSLRLCWNGADLEPEPLSEFGPAHGAAGLCDTVSSVSKALLHGLPVLLVVALIVLIYARSGKRTASYRLPQPWTHAPILWSAVDEPIPAAHVGHHGQHGADESMLSVGGGASGSW